MEGTNKKKLYRLKVNDNDETGATYMSMVENPAIQMEDFFAFSETGTERTDHFQFKLQSAEKRMVAGIFLVPNKPIKRINEKTGEEFYVYYEPEDVEMTVDKFHRKGYGRNIDIEHAADAPNCYIVDSWYVRNAECNPLKGFGFSDVPVSSWVGTIKVNNDEIWNEFIKTGKLTGFSIEGIFAMEEIVMDAKFSEEKPRSEYTDEELSFIGLIADFLLSDEKAPSWGKVANKLQGLIKKK